MAEDIKKQPIKNQSSGEVKPAQVKNSGNTVPVFTKVKNRTNQKQVVAFGEETFEFLAGETKQLPLSLRKAKEKFSVFLSKNILIITN